MKTRTKLAFIDQDGSKLTVYPIKPKDELVRDFRKKQLDTIDSEDRIYCALARQTDKWHETHYLDADEIGKYDDTFFGTRVGYINPDNKSSDFNHFEYWGDEPKHILKRSDYRFEDQVTSYLNGEMNSVPFRVLSFEGNGRKIQNFLPLSCYIGPFNGDNYAEMKGILHLPDLAYFEQLLRCNSIGILATRTAKVDGSLDKILDLFSFSKPQTIDIDDIRNSEKHIKKANELLYGDKIFHRELPLDYEQEEREKRPVSEDLLEQANIDKPLIEEVKKYLLRRK